jgi:anti-anti-sigma factor
MNLEITTENWDNGTCVVSAAGEIDLYSCGPLDDAMQEALVTGASRLVVDLSECAFLDSTALKVLLAANRDMYPDRLIIVLSDDRLRKVFESAGLERVFGIVGSRGEAWPLIERERRGRTTDERLPRQPPDGVEIGEVLRPDAPYSARATRRLAAPMTGARDGDEP